MLVLDQSGGFHEESGVAQCSDPACRNFLSTTTAASWAALRTEIRLRVLQSCQRRNISQISGAYFTLGGHDLSVVLALMRTVAGVEAAEWKVTNHRHGGVSVRGAWVFTEIPDISRFLSFQDLLPLKAGRVLHHRVSGSILLTISGDAVFVAPPFQFELVHCGRDPKGQERTKLRVRYVSVVGNTSLLLSMFCLFFCLIDVHVCYLYFKQPVWWCRYNICLLASGEPEHAEIRWAPDYEWDPTKWPVDPRCTRGILFHRLEVGLCRQILELWQRQEQHQGLNMPPDPTRTRLLDSLVAAARRIAGRPPPDGHLEHREQRVIQVRIPATYLSLYLCFAVAWTAWLAAPLSHKHTNTCAHKRLHHSHTSTRAHTKDTPL